MEWCGEFLVAASGFAGCKDDSAQDTFVATRAKSYERYSFVIKSVPIGKMFYFLHGNAKIVGKEI